MFVQDELVPYLLANLPRARLASGGKEILSRCQFCGDSYNLSDAHFYISLGQKTNGVLLYNCFKCGESGILTFKTLRDIGLYDDVIGIELNKYNKSVSNTLAQKGISYSDIDIAHFANTLIRQSKETDLKLQYINSRLGFNWNYDDIIKNKIVLNLNDGLNQNHIQQKTRDDRIIEQLDQFFIGFLSIDNCFLTMRNLIPGKTYDSISKRYAIYNIFNKANNSKRYYVIPSQIDTMKKVKLHIAEGPFDVLSIKYNVRQSDDNDIYASVNGKSYLSLVKYFIMYLGIPNIELHLYPDNDVPDQDMSYTLKTLFPFNLDIYVHRNVASGEKDFGVKPEKIKEEIYQVQKSVINSGIFEYDTM